MTAILNSRVLLSLGVILAVSAALISATGAFFTDSETSTGNTFAAGTLDLTVDGGSWASPEFTITAGMPGDASIAAALIEVTADAWLGVNFDIESDGDTEDSALLADLDYVIYESSATTPNDITPLTQDTDGDYYPASYLAATEADYTVGVIACFGTLSSTDANDLTTYTCDGSSVGNDSQGGSVTASFGVRAEQYQNNENGGVNPLIGSAT